jgi:hypothetical protein
MEKTTTSLVVTALVCSVGWLLYHFFADNYEGSSAARMCSGHDFGSPVSARLCRAKSFGRKVLM